MKSKKKAAPFISGPEAWFRFAQDDQKVAKILLEDGPWNMVCFHAQQGSEKALKAFLRERSGDVPRVHSLGKLIEICAKTDRTFLRLKSIALSLDRYYIPTRYPEAAPGSLPEGLPDKSDAKQSVRDMQKILRHVRIRVKGSIRGPLGF